MLRQRKTKSMRSEEKEKDDDRFSGHRLSL